MQTQNPFDLLGLPPRFAMSRSELEKAHRELSKALHPDRHRDKPPGERRLLLERAMQVNEAHRILRDPIRRAHALLALRGTPVDEAQQVSPSPMFLMSVLEQREELAEARAAKNTEKLHALRETVSARRDATEAKLSEALAGNGVMRLTDSKGRAVVVPADKIAYVEVGSPTASAVGFR